MAVIVSGLISKEQTHAVSKGRREHRTPGGADRRPERTRWGIIVSNVNPSGMAAHTAGGGDPPPGAYNPTEIRDLPHGHLV